jgi:carboxymethylenebutenolidase
MKRIVITAAVCLLLGAAADRLIVMAAASQPAGGGGGGAASAGKPTYAMPNNETGQGNGQASQDRLKSSPRHQETIEVKVPGVEKPLKAFIVHPERADKAPVVLCIMEIFGMTDWVKATTDQLAADGFIAIAPDFLSLKAAGTQVSAVPDAEIMADLNACRDYALKLPNCNGKSATIGFCYGGGKSFNFASVQPELNAAVVFYGTPPADDALAKIKCPVAGFYGGNDNRVTSTVAGTTATLKRLEKVYEPHVFEGAGHGFMRQQTAGANAKAAQEAWPLVVKFLKDNTK